MAVGFSYSRTFISCNRFKRGLTSFISRSVDPRDQGKIQGMNSGLDTLAQLFGPLIGGLIISNFSLYWYGLIPAIIAIIPFVMSFIPLRYDIEEKNYKKEISRISQKLNAEVSIPLEEIATVEAGSD